MNLSGLKDFAAIIAFIIVSMFIYLFRDFIIKYITGFPSYIAIFALSFIGTCSVIIPIPYTAIIFILAGLRDLNPLAVALVGGLGSGLGEITGWIVGKLMSHTLESSRYSRQIHTLIKFAKVKGKYVLPLAIFVFALTPLPDDLLFIVLGMLNYRLLYAIIPCILGKITMLYLISFFGKMTWRTAQSIGISDELIMMLTIVVLTIILGALMFVKWDKILEKYMNRGTKISK